MTLSILEQAAAAIHRSQRPLIVFPAASLDAAASALALTLTLQRLGKVADAAADGFRPPSPEILPDIPVAAGLPQLGQFIITVNLRGVAVEQFSYDLADDVLSVFVTPRGGQLRPADVTAATGEFLYDLIICVGTSDLEALGSLYRDHREFFQCTVIINIDHQAQNVHYGQINLVDLTAAATAEAVAGLIAALQPTPPGSSRWDQALATPLLAGLIAGTRGYRLGNVTAKTLQLASELMTAGANRDGIIRALFEDHTIPALKLWGRTLTRLKSELEGRLVWATVLETDFLETEATLDELPGLTEAILAFLPAAEVTVLLAQEGQTMQVRLTSLRHHSAMQLSQPFPATGDRHVAVWELTATSPAEAEREVVAAVRRNLQELRGTASAY